LCSMCVSSYIMTGERETKEELQKRRSEATARMRARQEWCMYTM